MNYRVTYFIHVIYKIFGPDGKPLTVATVTKSKSQFWDETQTSRLRSFLLIRPLLAMQSTILMQLKLLQFQKGQKWAQIRPK